jgi:hypothetical protein
VRVLASPHPSANQKIVQKSLTNHLTGYHLSATLTGMYESIPHTPRQVRATEARLKRIYNAAYYGLKGDNLALAAGMLPSEFKQLCELDPAAELSARQGKADAEMDAATHLWNAARGGDARSALAILQHSHSWAAKEAQQSFGANGITINISAVEPAALAAPHMDSGA